MSDKTITAALLSIAAANTHGFTVNAQPLEPITSGYAVALAETQDSFGVEGLERVINFVKNNAGVTAYGGWLNEESGHFYWDATMVVADRATAERLACANGQLAFFDLNAGLPVYVREALPLEA